MDAIVMPRPKFKPITLQFQNLIAIHRDSHVIAKVKPKIRIIHIIAPQVIKTDVTNFRDIVQRLTGKPGKEVEITKGSKSRRRRTSTNSSSTSSKLEEKIIISGVPPKSLTKVDKVEVELGLNGPNNVMWGSGDNNKDPTSGFVDGFSDLNYGFMHELADGFPLVSIPPVPSSSHHHHHHHHRHMDLFGDIRFS